MNAYYIMSSIETTQILAQRLRPLFRLWPAYNVGDGFIQMAQAFWERKILGFDSRPFDWDAAGKPLALLYCLTLPYLTILLFLEYSHDCGSGGLVGRLLRSFGSKWQRMMLRWYGVRERRGALLLNDGLTGDEASLEDEDVKNERLYVTEHTAELRHSAPVLYVNLWKIYPPSIGLLGVLTAAVRQTLGSLLCCICRSCSNRTDARAAEREDRRKARLPKRAVRGVTTAVREGETYALLGKNGAGKTTTLGVLTGDATATSGSVYVAGYDVTGKERNGLANARHHIGFCPQVDPLLDLMTGRETLKMFAILRGIPLKLVDSEVNTLLERLTLTPHADKTTETFSGGNKRKLSLGIALIGDPKVLLIDEPSTGLDPVAKRKGMWTLISEVSKDRSVILTTHSMQEAEALCTRAGIMSDGQLLCLGTSQHLKSKYLDGYTIDLVCQPDSRVEDLLQTALPLLGAELVEQHGRFVRLSVANMSSSIGLGTTFERLEAMKQAGSMENYTVSQCSLEQVFIKLISQSGERRRESDVEEALGTRAEI